jgi:hypothetical protein
MSRFSGAMCADVSSAPGDGDGIVSSIPKCTRPVCSFAGTLAPQLDEILLSVTWFAVKEAGLMM